MRIALPDWTALTLFAATILSVTLYGLALSIHFPPEHRRASLQGRSGRLVLWGTAVIASASAIIAMRLAYTALPPYAVVIATGAAILMAPMMLKPLPDALIDDRGGLLMFSAISALLALLLAWI